jgi:hypothetical protein
MKCSGWVEYRVQILGNGFAASLFLSITDAYVGMRFARSELELRELWHRIHWDCLISVALAANSLPV